MLEKCYCGIGFVDIRWRNADVAKVSLISAGEMLLWLRFRGHRKCCRGYNFVDTGFELQYLPHLRIESVDPPYIFLGKVEVSGKFDENHT